MHECFTKQARSPAPMSCFNLNYYVQYKKAMRENRRKKNTLDILFIKILLHIYMISYTRMHIHINGHYIPRKKGRFCILH